MRGIHLVLGAGLVLGGCDGGGGEPITGTLSIHYGSEGVYTPTTGAALAVADSPTRMSLFFGTTGIDCGLDVETFSARGAFVTFAVDNQAPGTHATSISVSRLKSNSASYNSGSGSVVIDAIGEERITGNVAFSTTDNDVGEITVDGTFDVFRCF